MPADTKKTVREFKVTVIVEEIDAPKVADVPLSNGFWQSEVEEFLDEGDFGPGILMFETFRFHLALAKLQSQHSRIETAFEKEIAQAKAEKKSSIEIYRIEDQQRWEIEMSNDEIDMLTSKYWQSQARIYQVADSRDSSDWIPSRQFGGTYLSTAATARIRSDIRAEKKAKWDAWQKWVTLGLSIFGSVIGMLAYFKK